jgi:F-type H+-transporting ATPase subunit a
MDVDIHGAPIYFEIPILGGIPISATLVVTWGVMLVLTLLCIWLTHGMKVKNISKKQAFAEFIVQKAESFVTGNMGEKWKHYTPFVSTIFALSIVCSLSALFGLWPPTADVSTTLAWGIVVFVIITATKLKTNGLLGYLKGFCDPIFVMAPFNVLGELFTPISMAFRHFGNIVSGTVITSLVYAALVVANHALFSLIPGVVGDWLSAIPFLTVGVPAVISLYFDWFSGFMQAFIFCTLTMVFISSAAETE